MRPPGPGSHAQHGTSLVEVLVTVTVLSLGIVAMASLQTTALKLGQSAYQRSQAVALSYQIIDAMRANRPAALAGAYDWPLGQAAPGADATGLPAADIRFWLLSVTSAMEPYQASGGVTRQGEQFTVTIRWSSPADQARAAEGETWTEAFSVVVRL